MILFVHEKEGVQVEQQEFIIGVAVKLGEVGDHVILKIFQSWRRSHKTKSDYVVRRVGVARLVAMTAAVVAVSVLDWRIRLVADLAGPGGGNSLGRALCILADICRLGPDLIGWAKFSNQQKNQRKKFKNLFFDAVSKNQFSSETELFWPNFFG